jgi:hypothetical protein
MRRRAGVLLVAGWVLGLLTTMVGPDFVHAHTSSVTPPERAQRVISVYLDSGYTLERSQRVTDSVIVLEFQRPRYMSIVDVVRNGW